MIGIPVSKQIKKEGPHSYKKNEHYSIYVFILVFNNQYYNFNKYCLLVSLVIFQRIKVNLDLENVVI
jgi:hypothetical protein